MSNLSLEQQFNVRSFEQRVQGMSREQALHFLVEMYRQMLAQENSYKDLLKHRWGMDLLPEIEEK
jgi:Phycobilisome degradation protein nblA